MSYEVEIIEMAHQPFAVVLRRAGRSIGIYGGVLVAALLVWPCCFPASAAAQGAPSATAPAPSAAMTEYRRKLEEYTRARAKFDDEAGAYWKSIADIPEVRLKQIQHFFEHYKDLEAGKWVKVLGWAGVEVAHSEILDGIKRYQAERTTRG